MVRAAALAATLVAATATAGLVAATSEASAVDPQARLCRAYAGKPKGFGAGDARARTAGMSWVAGGAFLMGSEDFYPEERPVHRVSVGGFWIDRHEVTNAQFAAFVAATGWRTVAETGLDPKDHPGLPAEVTAPGSMVFVMPANPGRTQPETWWRYVHGADWRHPGGPGTSIDGKDAEPVVHVAWRDARAYADWLGRDLPTEAEWEYAARGGLEGRPYAWGSEVRPDGRYMANSWQGVFPVYDEGSDGFHGLAPVGCYEPNGLGLFDMTGNVWEWTGDWWAPGHTAEASLDPQGPMRNPGGDEALAARVIKGGSWLCSSNYCGRYRPAARQPHEIDLGASHVGFRTVLRGRPPADP